MEQRPFTARRARRGFTLAELLVVVAIIAVLVAVAIPTFSAAKERAQAGVCMANRRSLYGQLTYARMLNGLTQAQADQLRDDFGLICPAGGTIQVELGDTITVKCSVHGETSSGGDAPAADAVSQGLLKDFMAFVQDPGDAVKGSNRNSNNELRKAFFAQNGNRWPTLTVDGKQYQIEPFVAFTGNSPEDVMADQAAYTWLCAREKREDGQVINKWNVPLVYDPRTGLWYESRNYLGTGQFEGSITAKNLDELEVKLQETHTNGNPKWRVVEFWQES